jgi:hypothetical protein
MNLKMERFLDREIMIVLIQFNKGYIAHEELIILNGDIGIFSIGQVSSAKSNSPASNLI